MPINKKLFGNHIDPACTYCEKGRQGPDNIMILCSLNGPVSPYYKCGSFIYDPLKRVPKRQPKLPDYSPDDFTID